MCRDTKSGIKARHSKKMASRPACQMFFSFNDLFTYCFQWNDNFLKQVKNYMPALSIRNIVILGSWSCWTQW